VTGSKRLHFHVASGLRSADVPSWVIAGQLARSRRPGCSAGIDRTGQAIEYIRRRLVEGRL
jgi:hypothetical protein